MLKDQSILNLCSQFAALLGCSVSSEVCTAQSETCCSVQKSTWGVEEIRHPIEMKGKMLEIQFAGAQKCGKCSHGHSFQNTDRKNPSGCRNVTDVTDGRTNAQGQRDAQWLALKTRSGKQAKWFLHGCWDHMLPSAGEILHQSHWLIHSIIHIK